MSSAALNPEWLLSVRLSCLLSFSKILQKMISLEQFCIKCANFYNQMEIETLKSNTLYQIFFRGTSYQKNQMPKFVGLT